jgi:hypothetical protein
MTAHTNNFDIVGLNLFCLIFYVQNYLGLQSFRLYFKCTQCSAELTIMTDPKNSDYIVESGAARSIEPWRADDHETCEMKKQSEAIVRADELLAAMQRKAADKV